jgi:hypothetical protein
MARLRRRLRAFAAAWLVIHAAWLSAVVPPSCCRREAVPVPTQQAEHTCHDTAASRREPPAADCVLRAGCDPQGAAILGLLSGHGLMPSVAVTAPAFAQSALSQVPRDSVLALLTPPDPPPPRG